MIRRRIRHQHPTLISEQARRGSERVLGREHAPAHEQIEIAVSVIVGEGQGTRAARVALDGGGHDRADGVRSVGGCGCVEANHTGGLRSRTRTGRFVVHLSQEQRQATGRAERKDGGLIERGRRRGNRNRGETIAVVSVKLETPTAPVGDQQVVVAVPVDIVPGHPRTEPGQRVEKERLPFKLGIGAFDMRLRERPGHLAEHGCRGGR